MRRETSGLSLPSLVLFFDSLLFYFDTRNDLRTNLALDAHSIGREEVLGGRSSVAALFAVCIP